ncbi:ABC transporter permease subunit [Luedemannella flava]
MPAWAKAGLIIKADTTQGSTYAAIMVTGAHGVRMQHNFTEDIAGPTGARWLRLTRSGKTITGYASADGTTWAKIGEVQLSGLPADAQAGLFATSPATATVTQHLGGGGMSTGGRSTATATFDSIATEGVWAGAAWQATSVGDPMDGSTPAVQQSGSTVTVSGSGDIAPDVAGAGVGIERVLIGTFAAATVVAVLGVLFITTEYRRGMIRTTLAARPRRGRVLAAKAVVIGGVAFVAGALGALVTLPVSLSILRENGNYIYHASTATQARIVLGTAAVLAVTAVLALAIGTIVRRSAVAVATVVLLVVLPYLLASAAVLPAGPSQWLLRLTPAAGMAIQQTALEYAQVDFAYSPAFGFFPLSPWGGFAVLCAYAVAALGLAAWLLRRRDA